jgi:hypothetical protein
MMAEVLRKNNEISSVSLLANDQNKHLYAVFTMHL